MEDEGVPCLEEGEDDGGEEEVVAQEVHYTPSNTVYQDCQRDDEDEGESVGEEEEEEGVLRSHRDDASSLEDVDRAS